jgi:hypothetical protein
MEKCLLKQREVSKILNNVHNPHLPTKELLNSCGKGKKEILVWVMGKHLSFLTYPTCFVFVLFWVGRWG